MNLYRQFVHKTRYARYVPELGARESWPQTVARYTDFWRHQHGSWSVLDPADQRALPAAIERCEVMPSMRALATAGPALAADNTVGYNCAYTPVDSIDTLPEILYTLMCGAGVGFSCEARFVRALPPLGAGWRSSRQPPHVVEDSRAGWARAYSAFLHALWRGELLELDYSRVRPRGAPLVTMGGQASGPGALAALCSRTRALFERVAARGGGGGEARLRDDDVHRLVCLIGEIVVVGGVRRSALISLSDLDSARMAAIKHGDWLQRAPELALANNSVAYDARPTRAAFDAEFNALRDSGNGERGFYNRAAALRNAPTRRTLEPGVFGCNPCSEIDLQPRQFCNLSEVVVRADDSVADLERKVRAAALLGTLQAQLVDFKFLSPRWHEQTARERLLGVSLTGIYDSALMNGSGQTRDQLAALLRHLRDVARDTNVELAARLGIPAAAAVTCVKPSGTVSQLVDAASGIHPRYAEYYLRRVRNNADDPVSQLMIDSGVPYEHCDYAGERTLVFTFAQRAPAGARLRRQVNAVEHLTLWQLYLQNWCEHKPSATISVGKHEWEPVREWLWRNFDSVSGLTLLPADDADIAYSQAPYEECSAATYAELSAAEPAVDWARLADYEYGDRTQLASGALACGGSGCEL